MGQSGERIERDVKAFFKSENNLDKKMKSLLVVALLSAGFFGALAAKQVDGSDVGNVESDGAEGDGKVLVMRKRRDSIKADTEKKNKKRKLKRTDKQEKHKLKKNQKINTKKQKSNKVGEGKKKRKDKGTKQKRKDKEKKNKKKRKNKKRKNKKRKNKKSKNKNKNTSSGDDLRSKRNTTCSTEAVPENCLENAQTALNYEKNQVTNYLKQAARLKGHKNIKEKKLFKKGEFEHAAEHLIFAVGGNMSNPKCGDPNDNSTEALATKAKELQYILSNYTLLMNCSNAIHEACTLSNETFNDSHQAQLDSCNQTKWQFILDSRKCHKLQSKSTNATEICECWDQAAEDVEAIKSQSCDTKEKQQTITRQKNFCKKVFKDCKEMEDHSTHLTWHCMHDHSMHLINQTSKSIHEGIIKDAKALTGEEKLLDFSFFDYK